MYKSGFVCHGNVLTPSQFQERNFIYFHGRLKARRKPIRVWKYYTTPVVPVPPTPTPTLSTQSPSIHPSVCPSSLLQVVGFGAQENDEEDDEEEGKKPMGGGGDEPGRSAYGEVSKLTFLQPSDRMAGAVAIMDIPAFTRGLPLFPYHKILE